MVDLKLLKRLMDVGGVSGSEAKIRSLIIKEIKPYVDKIKTDKSGNLIAHQKGPKPTVMLAAHMDEVGLMVKSIDQNGLIEVDKIGDIESMVIIGQKVWIETKNKPVQGVVTTKDLSDSDEIEELPEDGEIIIDTGLNKKELSKLGVRVGSFINLIQENSTLSKKEIICGKALDDRIGCYILIQLAKACNKTRKSEIYFVFTVQEEMGLYGAKTSAYEIKPDWAIAIDTTEANDAQAETPTQVLGKGVSITAKDADMIGNKCINTWLEEIAKKRKIPIQWDVSDRTTTDAINIYFSGGGVPATVVGVPVRNSHSTIGIANTKDIDNTVKLLNFLLKNPPKKCV